MLGCLARGLGFGVDLVGEVRLSTLGALVRRGRPLPGRATRKRLGMDDTVHRATFVVVILFAVVLRVVFLSQPMRFDEALTFVHFASPPLPRGLYNYASPNNHIFHTLQVHIAYRVFGDDPWAIRLPACVAGVLIVPATYLLIRRLYNRDAALLASGCAASSSALIEFSTNARGYSLVTLTFLALLVVATFLKRRPFRGAWVLFAVLAALGFYTMPIMAYPFAIVVAWLVLSLIGSVSPGERRRVSTTAIAAKPKAVMWIENRPNL